MPATRSRIAGLDGLRALAVLMVFADHRIGLEIGQFGVWLFFVLSGFLVIDILYYDQSKVAAGLLTRGAALRNFLYRRSIRILPIYYLYLLVTLPLSHLARHIPHVDALGALMNFTFLSNIWIAYILDAWPGPFSSLWTLSIEQQFYICFALGAYFFGQRGVLWLAVTAVAVAVVQKCWLTYIAVDEIKLHSDTVINAGMIGLGGVVALQFTHLTACNRYLLPSMAMAVYVALVTMAALHLISNAPTQLYAPLLAAALILSVYTHQDSLAVRCLEWVPLQALGVISYGFYLYHQMIDVGFLTNAVQRFTDYNLDARSYPAVIVDFLISITVAALSWCYIEKPLLRRFRPRPPGAATSIHVTVASQNSRHLQAACHDAPMEPVVEVEVGLAKKGG